MTRFLVLSLFLLTSSTAAAQDTAPVSKRVGRLEEWLRALVHHTPGEIDSALTAFGEWPESDLQNLYVDALALATLVREPEHSSRFSFPGTVPSRSADVVYSRGERTRMATLACVFGGQSCLRTDDVDDLRVLHQRMVTALQDGDPNRGLRLGALLQADLAMWGRTQDSLLPASVLHNGGVWLDTTDGRGGPVRQKGIQWLLAYGLLDRVMPPGATKPAPAQDPFVRDWYVATTFWTQDAGSWDQAHVNRGLGLFPDDPDLRFLSATQHEIDAGPVVQNALKSIALPVGVTTDVKSVKSELGDAVSDLRRALHVRPDWGEARVRLGRILASLGALGDAATELRAALDQADDEEHRYYATMTLGYVREAEGNFDDAGRLYHAAADLFPLAQSPPVALSHLARRRGDRTTALAELQKLFGRDPAAAGDFRGDPWWTYLRIQARTADARLDALCAPFRRHD